MPLLADGLHNSRHGLQSWATLIHWLPPTSSMLSLHPLLGLPVARLPSLGIHCSWQLGWTPREGRWATGKAWYYLGPPGVAHILAICPAHCPLMHCTLSIISTTFVLNLITSFWILSLFVMFSNDLSMLRWATAIFSYFPLLKFC